MAKVFGNDFSQTDVEKGIDAVKNVGKVFKDIVEGLKAWMDPTMLGIDVERIGKNINDILTTTTTVFANIGKGTSGCKLFGFEIVAESSNVERGINSCQGLGQVVKELADGIKIWNDLEKAGIDTKKIGDNMREMIELTSNVFADIGKKAFLVTSHVDGKQTWVTDNLVRIGVDVMRGSGEKVMNMATALKTMSEIANPQEIQAHQTNIKDMLYFPLS